MAHEINNKNHEQAIEITTLYKKYNKKTSLKVSPRSEEDKKQKIWRLNIVKRDENASKIHKHIKTESQLKRMKQEQNKVYKKEVKVPKEKKPTLKELAYPLLLEGKTYAEIAELLGSTTVFVRRSINIKRNELGLPLDVPTRTKSDHTHRKNCLTGQIWRLYMSGKTPKEISVIMQLPIISVRTKISNKKNQYRLIHPDDNNPLTMAVKKMVEEGLHPSTIAEKLNKSLSTIRYHYYKVINSQNT